ncbi:MAG: TRAP transporter small permease [Salinarimonadaceae bacterium]|nr:MAG: TRAP transporter small permease [Salinarimonadaceae bacterium]
MAAMRILNAVLDAIETATRRVNGGLIVIAGWGILAIMLFTTYSVTMRYAFRQPDTWSYPVSAYLLCLVIFLSAAHTLQANVHVRVDYLIQLAPRRVAIALCALGDFASSVFLGIFVWQLNRLFNETLARGRVDETTLGWPLAAIQWSLPVGAGLLLLTHLVLIVSHIRRGDYGRPETQIH